MVHLLSESFSNINFEDICNKCCNEECKRCVIDRAADYSEMDMISDELGTELTHEEYLQMQKDLQDSE